MSKKTIFTGIGFLFAWIIGAVFVEALNFPTPIYAIIVVCLEIATIYSIFADLAHGSVDRY
jgi:hypothetical protein